MGKCGPPRTKQIIYHSKGIDESYPKKCTFYWIWTTMSKIMGIFQILAYFMMPAHQIWSCHVTQKANFEKVLFFPNSAFNIRKSYKISGKKALYFRSYQPKTSQGGGEVETLPGAFRVKVVDSSRIFFFENMVWYFQKCFGIWTGARISKKTFITVQKIHLPEKVWP